MSDVIKKNGPIVHLNLVGTAYVLLTDPDDIKVSNRSIFSYDKGGWARAPFSIYR